MLGLTPLNKNGLQRRAANDVFDLYNIFDDFFNYDGFLGKSNKFEPFKVDLKEQNDYYFVEAELPGFKKEEISLNYEEGKLLIEANHAEENKEESEKYIHRERKTCSMRRAIYLKDIQAEQIQAKLEDGLLKIEVPKSQPTVERKQIEIR